jgi:predicted P-loop ATPase
MRKSQMVRTLVPNPDWFTDQLSNVTHKDAKMEVAGVMIIELAEMEVLTRATSSAMKRFITHDVDRFRPPYGRTLIKWPRQFVFIGTMNPIPGEGYLKDPTGARRFWPVRCLGRDLTDDDIETLKRDRDQLMG